MPPLVLDDDWINRWATELTTGRTKWWVAENDGSLGGFVGIGPSRDPVDPELGELDTIAVDPGQWRTGDGHQVSYRHSLPPGSRHSCRPGRCVRQLKAVCNFLQICGREGLAYATLATRFVHDGDRVIPEK